MSAVLNVADLYAAIHGVALDGSGEERQGHCPNPKHADANPSCGYNLAKNVFHCLSCGAKGNVKAMLELVLPDMDPQARREWLTERGLSTTLLINPWDTVSVTYDYVDDDGKTLLYQVGRWNLPNGGKDFRQRRSVGKNNWSNKLGDVRRVPFMLPELINSVRRGETIYVVEGEKDVLNLMEAGLCATTNAQGAENGWPDDWAHFFKGAQRVVVIADNDKPGQRAAKQRAKVILEAVRDVRVIEGLPGVGPKGDVSDWLAITGNNIHGLTAIVDATPAYVPEQGDDAVEALVRDLSDTGNGQWFNAQMRSKYRYVSDYKAWMRYEGGVWTKCSNMMSASEHAVNLMRTAAEEYAGALCGDFKTHAERSRSVTSRRQMLESAQGPAGIEARLFDKRPRLFNCANGTLDLDSGELLAFEPDHYLTHKSDVAFDAAATCPQFESWLRQVVNDSQPLFDYLQMLMGSCLESRAGLRRFFMLIGPKGTGKSTFIRTLEKVLGEYQTAIDWKTIIEAKFVSDGTNANPNVLKLKDRRLVTASEADESHRLDVAQIKRLIGGDTIQARGLYQEAVVEFKFDATLLFTGNQIPKIVGDESVWDKFKPIPFLHEIEGEDPNFEAQTIDPELSGILNFAVQGLRMLGERQYVLTDPQEVIETRNAEMESQDPFGDCFAEMFEESPSDAMDCDQAYGTYMAWCARNKQYGFSRKKFTRWLRTKRGINVDDSGSKKRYIGLRLKFKDDAADYSKAAGF